MGCPDLGNVDDSAYSDIVIVNGEQVVLDIPLTWDIALSERAVIYQGDHKIIVSRLAFNTDHLAKIRTIAGWTRVLNIYPDNPSESLCNDLMEQEELNRILKRILRNSPGVNIVARNGFDSDFFKLTKSLRGCGFSFKTLQNMDDGDDFLSRHFDHKSVFRTAFSSFAHKTSIKIPKGFTVHGKADTVDACFLFKKNNQSCAVKQDRGFSGEGIVFMDHVEFSANKGEFVKKITNELMDDKKCTAWGAWATWDACNVVEEIVDIDRTTLEGCISVEFQVLEGKVLRLYACIQRMEDDGKCFKGIVISPEVENHPLIQEAYKVGAMYGEIIASHGYRGFFDVDLLISKDGHGYALESNARRTGGTHVHQFASNLLGEGYFQHYWILEEEMRLGDEALDYQTYCNLFEDLYLKKAGEDERRSGGMILLNPTLLTEMQALDVMIIGRSEAEMIGLYEEIKTRLRNVRQT